MTLKCTLFENRYVWFRKTDSRSVGQIRLYIYTKITKHLHRLACRLGNYSIELCLNPHEGQVSITIGRRYFDYGWFVLKHEGGEIFSNKEFVLLRRQERENLKKVKP